jgi:glucose/arabinose dehydrogenase
MDKPLRAVLVIGCVAIAGCESAKLTHEASVGKNPVFGEVRKLPLWVPAIHYATPKPFADDTTPVAAAGLSVTEFAHGLDHPRWLYVLPNGDVLVAETNHPPQPQDGEGIRGHFQNWVINAAGAGTPSANRITRLRDVDGDGKADESDVFLQGLKSPFGMALIGDQLYVANTDGVVRFPYRDGDKTITAAATFVVGLPAGPRNHHWTKNILASGDGRFLYASVGSNSNAGDYGIDAESERATIWRIDVVTGKRTSFAEGLRNANGMAWEPETNALWTVVNERDEIGSDLVPDYLTAVPEGSYFGFPYTYWGGRPEPRLTRPEADAKRKVRMPDYALGNHVAPLGLAFAQGAALGPRFASGAFVGEHGSWNRRPFSGYNVVFIPFNGGQPLDAKPIEVLGGFLDEARGLAKGRPVGVAIDKGGGLLVADDVANKIWRVTASR